MAVTITDDFENGAADPTSSVDGAAITLVPPITWTGVSNNTWGWWLFRADGVQSEALSVVITTGSDRAFGQGAGYSWGWVTKDLPTGGGPPNTTQWVQCPFTYGASSTTITMPAGFTDDTDSLYCAMWPAYPMARLDAKFAEWTASEYATTAPGFSGYTAGSTTATTTLFSGRAIPALPMRIFRVNQGFIPDDERKTVLITNGNHPGESMGRWAFEGFMDWLLSEDADAERLRRYANVIVLPHVCPSGTHGGYFRTAPDQSDNDHNRQWDQGETAPETVQLALAAIETATGFAIDAHLDFHAQLSDRPYSELWYPAATPPRDMFAFEGEVVKQYGRIAWTDFSNAGAAIDYIRSVSTRTVTISTLPDVLSSNDLDSVEQIQQYGEACGISLSKTLFPPIGRTSEAIVSDIVALLPANGRLWLASSGVTVTGQGVSSWIEQAGDTLDITQTTDASRPEYLTLGSTIGHRPAIRFVRSGDDGPFLTIPNDIISYGANGASTFIGLGDFSGVSNNEAWCSFQSTDTNALWRFYTRSNGTRVVPMMRQTVTSNQNAIDYTPRYPAVLAFTNSGTSSGVASSYTARFDGELVTVATEGSTIGATMNGGAVGRLPTPSFWHTGNFCGFIIVPGVMDAEDIVAISNLLIEYRDTADVNEWPAYPVDPGPPADDGLSGGGASSASFSSPDVTFIFPPEYWRRRA